MGVGWYVSPQLDSTVPQVLIPSILVDTALPSVFKHGSLIGDTIARLLLVSDRDGRLRLRYRVQIEGAATDIRKR